MNSLYGFLSPEKPTVHTHHHIINIDDKVKNYNDLCNIFGEILYGKIREKNPIFENTTYFGNGPNSFSDCLSNYFFAIKDTSVRVNIYMFYKTFSNDDILSFFNILIFNISTYNNFNNRLQIFLSSKVINLYKDAIEDLRDFKYEKIENEFL